MKIASIYASLTNRRRAENQFNSPSLICGYMHILHADTNLTSKNTIIHVCVLCIYIVNIFVGSPFGGPAGVDQYRMHFIIYPIIIFMMTGKCSALHFVIFYFFLLFLFSFLFTVVAKRFTRPGTNYYVLV